MMKRSGITFSKLFWANIMLGILLPLTNVHMISNQIYAQQTQPQQQFQQPQQQFQQPQQQFQQPQQQFQQPQQQFQQPQQQFQQPQQLPSTAVNVPVGMSP